jgi:hypothetical protein
VALPVKDAVERDADFGAAVEELVRRLQVAQGRGLGGVSPAGIGFRHAHAMLNLNVVATRGYRRECLDHMLILGEWHLCGVHRHRFVGLANPRLPISG